MHFGGEQAPLPPLQLPHHQAQILEQTHEVQPFGESGLRVQKVPLQYLQVETSRPTREEAHKNAQMCRVRFRNILQRRIAQTRTRNAHQVQTQVRSMRVCDVEQVEAVPAQEREAQGGARGTLRQREEGVQV